MKKVYFGCSLQHASQQYIDDVYKLREELKKDFEILEFLGLNNGTDAEVFAHDTNGVSMCDLLIAEVSLPSTGLGYEIGLADSLGKEIIVIAQRQAKVSAMVKGNPRITFIQCDDVQKVIEILKKEYA